MSSSLQHTLDFLRDLEANNNRQWFTDNRARYDAARGAFEDLIEQILERFDIVDDLGGVSPAQTMYRINRDVRFSADKSPYKTHMGALLGKDGRKTTGRWYYVQVQPDGSSMIAGGLHTPSPEELDAFRQAIAADARPLRAIIESETFTRYFGKLSGEQLKTAPKGYAKTHPEIELLRFKQFLALHPLTDAQVVSDGLVDHIIEVCKALKPFAAYVHDTLERPRE